VTGRPFTGDKTLPDYQEDVLAILAKRNQFGADFWTTPDGRVGKGSPFSTLECVLMLSELGLDRSHPTLSGACELLWSLSRADGRFRIAPLGTIYPCHTIGVARVLCYAGRSADPRMERTFQHLLETQHGDGGWRCKKFSFGRGPETEFSNPGPTLDALDAFRFSGYLNREGQLDKAVEFLLKHWVTRQPLGPCHFGIGALFLQVEYPFRRYNLFHYLHTLSFYVRARSDPRYREALGVLQAKLRDGMVIVENPHKLLTGYAFCRRGELSIVATQRYREIVERLR
jgi:hypothetical protein